LLFFSLFYLGGERSYSELIDYKRGLRIIIYLYIAWSVWANLLIRRFPFNTINLTSKTMLAYAIIAMATSAYSPDRLITLWKGFEVFVHVSMAFALSAKIKKTDDLKYALDMLCLVLLFFIINLSISGILFSEEAFHTYMFAEYSFQTHFALTGVFPKIHPNSSSQIGAMFALIGVSYLMINEIGRRRQNAIICLIFGVTIMLLGHARTSNIAFFLVLAFIILSSGKIKNKWIFVFFVFAFFSLALLMNELMEVVYAYLRRGQTQDELLSLTGRTYMWQMAIKDFLKEPWIGYGYYSASKEISSRIITGGSNIDNTYLNVLIGGGVILAFPLILSAIHTLISLWKTKKKTNSSTKRIIWTQTTGIFLLIFIRSFSGPTFDANHFNLMMFLVCSLAFSRISGISD
jgi:O-antigen ligase